MKQERGSRIPTIQGKVVRGRPLVSASLTPDGRLALGRGKLTICVDTGFTGDLALPPPILERLDIRYAGPMEYELADGTMRPMDQWQGFVIVSGYVYEAFFIEGTQLLGMDFIEQVGRNLRIDLLTGRVAISLRR